MGTKTQTVELSFPEFSIFQIQRETKQKAVQRGLLNFLALGDGSAIYIKLFLSGFTILTWNKRIFAVSCRVYICYTIEFFILRNGGPPHNYFITLITGLTEAFFKCPFCSASQTAANLYFYNLSNTRLSPLIISCLFHKKRTVIQGLLFF